MPPGRGVISWGSAVRLTTILPQLAGLQIEQLQVAADVITVRASGRGEAACCPVCGERSSRVQSRYQRTVADRPVGGRRLSLVLRVRRFVCHNGACPRRVFAERFPQLVEPYARRTTRHQGELRQFGLALGGRAGARLAARLGLAASQPATVLAARSGSMSIGRWRSRSTTSVP